MNRRLRVVLLVIVAGTLGLLAGFMLGRVYSDVQFSQQYGACMSPDVYSERLAQICE